MRIDTLLQAVYLSASINCSNKARILPWRTLKITDEGNNDDSGPEGSERFPRLVGPRCGVTWM